MFSEEFVRLARAVLDDDAAAARGPLVCVYNRTGAARILACRHCGELARCDRCGAAAARPRDEEVLRCPRCGDTRPVVCTACGRLRMKALRSGVTRLRDELQALLGSEVGEVAGPRGSGPEPDVPATPVLVGTEAVLHRVQSARRQSCSWTWTCTSSRRGLSATEETLALFVRASRLVGPGGAGPAWARVQVQTLRAGPPGAGGAGPGQPAPVLEEEVAIRRASALPPFNALALVSGALAPAYADALPATAASEAGGGVTLSPLDGDRFLVRAEAHERAL